MGRARKTESGLDWTLLIAWRSQRNPYAESWWLFFSMSTARACMCAGRERRRRSPFSCCHRDDAPPQCGVSFRKHNIYLEHSPAKRPWEFEDVDIRWHGCLAVKRSCCVWLRAFHGRQKVTQHSSSDSTFATQSGGSLITMTETRASPPSTWVRDDSPETGSDGESAIQSAPQSPAQTERTTPTHIKVRTRVWYEDQLRLQHIDRCHDRLL